MNNNFNFEKDVFKMHIRDAYFLFSNKNINKYVLAAKIGAACKTAKRNYVCDHIEALSQKCDITISISKRLVENIMGRGVSNKYLVDRFGTKGRTAANKSDAFDNDFSEFESSVRAKLPVFKRKLEKIIRNIKDVLMD
jgi:hypothetical protein